MADKAYDLGQGAGAIQRVQVDGRFGLAVEIAGVDLLGRPLDASGFLPDEVTAMRARIRALVDGQRDRLDHRLVLPDGRIRWIRSTLVSSTSPAGIRTISGVSVDITDAHDELERLRADVARLDRSIVTDTV